MNVLISGGSGLIGSAICKHLFNEGKWVYSYDFYPVPNQEKIGFWYAKEPLNNFIDPAHLSKPDVFIDCAMYKKPSEQFLTWNTVIDHFKKQNGGRMILFSSIYGHKAPDFGIYAGTEIPTVPLEYAIWKGGVEQATRYLAQRLKPWHIQVNAIAPGGVLDKHSETFQEEYRTSGRAALIQTRNLLPVVDMLIHPDNAVNGQIITVDGGWCL
jgi:NAD(P)-dependent dehydrogenase (short-subunit alcohol dehydrogenase family)